MYASTLDYVRMHGSRAISVLSCELLAYFWLYDTYAAFVAVAMCARLCYAGCGRIGIMFGAVHFALFSFAEV